ncbi:MAG: ComEC/Rec2 family competence protein [Pirellulales bacterium]
MHRASQVVAVRTPRRHHQPLVVALTAVVAGIVADRYAPLPLGAWCILSAAGLAVWSIFVRLRREFAAAATLLIALAGAAGAWHHCCWHLFSTDDIGHFASSEAQSIALEAIVREAPRIIEPPSPLEASASGIAPPPGYSPDSRARTRFEIEALAIRDDDRWLPIVGLADAQIDGRLESVAAGDRIRLFGRLSASPVALNPGEFDFAEHYRAERKLCIVRVAGTESVTALERCSPWDVAAHLSQLRTAGHRRLLAYVRGDQVGFASALLLGYRDLLARSDNWAFFRTGTVHVLSISGLHIGMLAFFLHAALRVGWLRRTTAILVTVGVTAAYALVIDAEPPAVRAVVVVVLVAIASMFGRRALSFNILGASALLVLAINPCDLFRAGPQLSFLAAAVLAWRSEQPRREPDEETAIELGRSRRRLWWEAHCAARSTASCFRP